MNVMITGGSGNLARYCMAELREHGHVVTLFDRLPPEKAPSAWSADVPFVVGDLTSAEDCRRALERAKADAIVHVGAIAYASEDEASRRSAEKAGQPTVAEDATFRVNVMGTSYLLDARDAAVAYRLAIEASDPHLNESFHLATDRSCAEEHRELINRYYPDLQSSAETMGPDQLIMSIRRVRERLGYTPRHSWRGEEANARVF